MSTAFDKDKTPWYRKTGRLSLGVVAIIGGLGLLGVAVLMFIPPLMDIDGLSIVVYFSSIVWIGVPALAGGIVSLAWGIHTWRRGGRDEPRITYKPGQPLRRYKYDEDADANQEQGENKP